MWLLSVDSTQSVWWGHLVLVLTLIDTPFEMSLFLLFMGVSPSVFLISPSCQSDFMASQYLCGSQGGLLL